MPDPSASSWTTPPLVVTYEQALVEHAPPVPDALSSQIAAHTEPLIADRSTLQVGSGAGPEAVVEVLRQSGRRDLPIRRMVPDAVVALDEADMLEDGPGPDVRTHDVLGARPVFDWLHDNDGVELVDDAACAEVAEIARVPLVVSINSAVHEQVELGPGPAAVAVDQGSTSGRRAAERCSRFPQGLAAGASEFRGGPLWASGTRGRTHATRADLAPCGRSPSPIGRPAPTAVPQLPAPALAVTRRSQLLPQRKSLLLTMVASSVPRHGVRRP